MPSCKSRVYRHSNRQTDRHMADNGYVVLFLRQSEILVENHDFFIPLHLMPQSGVGGGWLEYCILYGKTRMVWLSNSEKSLTICIAILTQYQRDGQKARQKEGQMDGWTDAQTSCNSTVSVMQYA